jgi:hypothetical protein
VGLLPRRLIGGISTELQVPGMVAVYQGELYVSDLDSVLVFPLAADGDVAPTRTLENVDRSFESQIMIDRNTGELYVLDSFSSVVRVYAASASGPATPVRTLGGPKTGLVAPSGVATLFGQLFVSDEQTGDIRVFPLDAEGDTARAQDGAERRRIAGASVGDPRRDLRREPHDGSRRRISDQRDRPDAGDPLVRG